MVARAALHLWEEPPISGTTGSGTIFFTNCSLRCSYCQNYEISHRRRGERVTREQLCALMLGLEEQGAVNINLVTASHYASDVADSVLMARRSGLTVPVVWNSSGYETTEVLGRIAEVVDVYIPDFKYFDPATSERYSRARDYPEIAKAAIDCMFRQHAKNVFDDNGIMQQGVIIRHLLLPGHTREAKHILQYLYDKYGPDLLISVMRQYTPPSHSPFPELMRKVRDAEYESVLGFAVRLGFENVFTQARESASTAYIPDFTNALNLFDESQATE